MAAEITFQDARKYFASRTASGILKINFDDDQQAVSGALGILCLKGQPPFNCLLTVSTKGSTLNQPKKLKINNLQQPAGTDPFILDTKNDVKNWIGDDLTGNNGSFAIAVLTNDVIKKLQDNGYDFLSTSALWPHKTVNLIVERGRNDYQLESMPVTKSNGETWFVEYTCEGKLNPALSGTPLFDDDICISALHVGGQQSRAAIGIQFFTETLKNKLPPGDAKESSADSDGKKIIFISYSQHHRPKEVRKVADDLTKEGFNVWIDKEKIITDLVTEICEGIDQADLVMIFMSERYNESPICLKECAYAEHMEKTILAVNLDFAFRDEQNKPRGGQLVFRLLEKVWIDFRESQHRRWSEVFQEIRNKVDGIFHRNNNTDEKKEETIIEKTNTKKDCVLL